MSLFGSMNTAVSGLNAQSAAFGNIGDDVANSQTIGYKRIDTTFEDYVTTSSAIENQPGAVRAAPSYVNTVQGTITQTDNPLNLAISGGGFFSVRHPVGIGTTGEPVFQQEAEYTREGDFSLNKDGYLVNASGDYLNGWVAGPNGSLNLSGTQPIQIDQSGFSPVPTANAALSANLPATPDGSSITTNVPVIDALGRSQLVNLTWAPVSGSSDTWSVAIAQADGTALGTATVAFGSAGNSGVPEGTIGSVTGSGGAVTAGPYSLGGAATLGITADFGAGPQALTLSLGHFGQADGLTQFAGTSYSPRSLTQDGVAPGSYNGVTTNANGDVVVNYDNGQSRVVARVPVVTFGNPDALQRQDGQAFSATQGSGSAQTIQSGSNGAGQLVSSSVETSNVDIAKEFTNLIVAQRAYTANTKMVTTADELLQSTIDMKR